MHNCASLGTQEEEEGMKDVQSAENERKKKDDKNLMKRT
jgi:hypothetical protein